MVEIPGGRKSIRNVIGLNLPSHDKGAAPMAPFRFLVITVEKLEFCYLA